MNDKIKQLLENAEQSDSIAINKWRIQNREQLRKERKEKLKELMEKDKQKMAAHQAKELVEKFKQLFNYTSQASRLCESTAKQCAIIHVNEMMKKLVELSDSKFTYLNDVMNYQEVKQEIEKI